MLTKKRNERREAINAMARKYATGASTVTKTSRSRDARSGRSQTSTGSAAVAGDTIGDVIDAGALIRQLGDDIDTRLREIDPEDFEDMDADIFAEKQRKLRDEADLAAGTQQRAIAQGVERFVDAMRSTGTSVTAHPALPYVLVPHNRNSVTCAALYSADAEHRTVVYGDKVGCVVFATVSGTSGEPGVGGVVKAVLEPKLPCPVLSIAVSDTRGARPRHNTHLERSTVDYYAVASYIAAGGKDGSIYVWDLITRKFQGKLHLHRMGVTGLAFRLQSHALISASEDNTLRVWSVPEMNGVDKFFGHQGPLSGVHCLHRETCVTASEDKTLRFWKLDQATQMEFRLLASHLQQSEEGTETGKPSPVAPSADASHRAKNQVSFQVEAVSMISDTNVFCGFRNGALAIFDVSKRKPVALVPMAHGSGFLGDGTGLEREASLESKKVGVVRATNPNSITAVATVPYADLGASASYDGFVNLWRFTGLKKGSLPRQAEPGSCARSAAMECVARLPIPRGSLVNGLQFADNGELLVIACAKEPRLGRWTVQSQGVNSVLLVPLSDRVQAGLPKPPTGQVLGGAVAFSTSTLAHPVAPTPGAAATGATVSGTVADSTAYRSGSGKKRDREDAPVAATSGPMGMAEAAAEEDVDEDGAFEVGDDGQLIFRPAQKRAGMTHVAAVKAPPRKLKKAKAAAVAQRGDTAVVTSKRQTPGGAARPSATKKPVKSRIAAKKTKR